MRIDGLTPRTALSRPQDHASPAEAPLAAPAAGPSANEGPPDGEPALRAASQGASLAAWAAGLDPMARRDRDDLDRLAGLVDQVGGDLLQLGAADRQTGGDDADPPARAVDVRV